MQSSIIVPESVMGVTVAVLKLGFAQLVGI